VTAPTRPVVHGQPFDPLGPGQAGDPYPWLSKSQREAPVFYMSSTRRDAMDDAVLLNSRGSEQGLRPRLGESLSHTILPRSARLEIAGDVRDGAQIGGRTA
jgi:hypothetical protein